MQFKKRGDKLYGIIYMGKEDGKKKYKWVSQKNKEKEKDFKDRCRQIEIDVHKGEYFEATEMTVKEYMAKWLDTYVKAELAEKTHRNYKYMIDNYICKKLGKFPLAKLKPLHIKDFYNSLKDKPDTAIYCHRVLHEALKHAVNWQMIKDNPSDKVSKPKPGEKKEVATWVNDEITDFTNQTVDNILYLPIVLAAATGMRRGEICGLRWQDIDWEKQAINVKLQLQRNTGQPLKLAKVKTHRSIRPIKISKEIIDILQAHRKNQDEAKEFYEGDYTDKDFVCCWDDGRPIDPDYLSKNFPKVAEKLGLPRINFHALRHSHATELLRGGIDILIVSRRLGHASIRTTADIYTNVDLDMQADAAEIVTFKKTEDPEKKKVVPMKKKA